MTATGTAISGLGMTRLGRVFGSSPRRLAASAVRLAAADAGMTVADIDGLLICPGIVGGLDVGLASVLGMRDLALLAVVNSFGASATTAVQIAAQAVASRTARAVACVFADTPLREGAPTGSAFGNHSFASSGSQGGLASPPERHGLAGLATGYGFRSVTVYYALAARRHMERYGTTSEQLGAIAVAQRQWAAGNPAAQYRDPISLADHQRSRRVAEPLHLLDCSLVSNGAIAVIVTSAAAAADAARPPVHIWGWGQGHPGQSMAASSDFGLATGAVQAGRAALAMAGVGPADITMCQIYDCYTYTVLVTLEDYGFCAKGQGGAFAASGALGPGGSLPVNTGGGQLSAYYMWGFTPLAEAVIQARGDGGARQSAATDMILVSGNGGILAHHGTLVLSPHPPGHRPSGGTDSDHGKPREPQPGEPQPGEPQPGEPQPREPQPREPQPGEPQPGGLESAALDEPRGEPTLAGPRDFGIVRDDPRSAPFFEAADRGELMIRRCERCGVWLAPTASGCAGCGEDADGLEWAQASGRGELVSWSVVHPRPSGPVAVPALVQLEEGPWLATGLRLDRLGQLAEIRAGQPVVVDFVRPEEGASYPVFRPVGSHG